MHTYTHPHTYIHTYIRTRARFLSFSLTHSFTHTHTLCLSRVHACLLFLNVPLMCSRAGAVGYAVHAQALKLWDFGMISVLQLWDFAMISVLSTHANNRRPTCSGSVGVHIAVFVISCSLTLIVWSHVASDFFPGVAGTSKTLHTVITTLLLTRKYLLCLARRSGSLHRLMMR